MSEDKNLGKSETKMSSAKANSSQNDKSRRKVLLASVAAAGAAGLPSEWKRPIVDSVLLPAHAQMSPSITTTSMTSSTGSPVTSSFTTQVSTTFTTQGVANCIGGSFETVTVGNFTTATSGVVFYDETRIAEIFTSCSDSNGATSSTTTAGFSYISTGLSSSSFPSSGSALGSTFATSITTTFTSSGYVSTTSSI